MHRDRVTKLSSDPAEIVYGLTGKKLFKAYPFRNLGNSHVFIAAATFEQGNPFTWRIYLLEEFGGAFRIAWQSGELSVLGPIEHAFAIHDVDRDGIHEVSVTTGGFGTGGGNSSLQLFVLKTRQVYELSIEFDWTNHTRGPTPKISLLPDTDDSQTRFYHRAIEEIARQSGFLESVKNPDLDNPLYADIRWHRDNGSIMNGSLVLHPHYYDGPPRIRNSITASLDEGDTAWIAYFKGPVVAHLKEQNKHCVIYCPENIYHWPTCLCRVGKLLLIGTREDGIIVYSAEEKLLTQFGGHGNEEFREVSTIRLANGVVVIDDSVRVPLSFFARFGSTSSLGPL